MFEEQVNNKDKYCWSTIYVSSKRVIFPKKKWINQFHATGLFLYPLKIENQRFFDVFKGYRTKLGT